MIIALPTKGRKGLTESVADHFGRCNTYTFIDGEGRLIEIIDNTSEHMGGSGMPPELIKKHGADILLCKELGPRALEACAKLGIDIQIGSAETVNDLYGLWKSRKVRKAGMGDVCEEHRI